MDTFLFDKTIFGPVRSRRLGISLGINLLPKHLKVCSFNCIYCECGWNPDYKNIKAELPTRTEVYSQLEEKLIEMKGANELPDVITFAGNGEPTMHPNFHEIVDDTLLLREKYAPKARIAVLSNSTMLFKDKVIPALKKVDDNILKLDSGIPSTIETMNLPVAPFDLDKLLGQLKAFEGKLTIQTMFLKGSFNGKKFDNTSDEEIEALIKLLEIIKPERIMIYTIARATPSKELQKISITTLKTIADKIHLRLDTKVEVSE